MRKPKREDELIEAVTNAANQLAQHPHDVLYHFQLLNLDGKESLSTLIFVGPLSKDTRWNCKSFIPTAHMIKILVGAVACLNHAEEKDFFREMCKYSSFRLKYSVA
jgi:hypothetical protein